VRKKTGENFLDEALAPSNPFHAWLFDYCRPHPIDKNINRPGWEAGERARLRGNLKREY
jgi:hypothetical protein